MRSVASLCGALMIVTAACAPSKETPEQAKARMDQESDAFKQAIAATARKYEAWTAAAQADSLASLFTEQGREMPPGEPAVVGRKAIHDYEARNAAMFQSKLAIHSEAAMASGALGIERGSYTFEGKTKHGAPKGMPASIHDEGKYLIHWHNVNGQWLIADMIWNANKMTGMPSSPATKSTKSSKPAKKKA
jgi:ketosteroid isomerase-like protein